MRALLGILCLFCTAPAVSASERSDAARLARTAEVRAVLREISANHDTPDERPSLDLPEDLRRALDA